MSVDAQAAVAELESKRRASAVAAGPRRVSPPTFCVGKVHRRNILVLGLSGAGKSSMLHTFLSLLPALGLEAAEPGTAVSASSPATRAALQRYSFRLADKGGGPPYSVCIGLAKGITDSASFARCARRVLEATKSWLSEIHHVVICAKAYRLKHDKNRLKELRGLVEALVPEGKDQYCTLMLNHCDVLSGKAAERQCADLRGVFPAANVLDVCLADPRQCVADPGVQRYLQERIQGSMRRFYSQVIEPCNEEGPCCPFKKLAAAPQDGLAWSELALLQREPQPTPKPEVTSQEEEVVMGGL